MTSAIFSIAPVLSAALTYTDYNHASPVNFGTGDGTTTSFAFPSVPTYSPIVYKSDWQGNQLQYSTPRTNLSEYSQDLTNAVWVKTNVTTAANAAVAPDGTTTMSSILETATTGEFYAEQFYTPSAGTWIWSIFVKAAGYTQGNITAVTVGEPTTVNYIPFDLSAVTIGPVGGQVSSAAITSYGSGIYKISIVFSTTNLTTSLRTRLNTGSSNHTGISGSGFYVWGSDFKVGSALTSYIPTTSSPVTVTDYQVKGSGIIL